MLRVPVYQRFDNVSKRTKRKIDGFGFVQAGPRRLCLALTFGAREVHEVKLACFDLLLACAVLKKFKKLVLHLRPQLFRYKL